MTEIRYYCDHCRSLITADRSSGKFRCGPFHRQYPELDLCGPCAEELVAGEPAGQPQARPAVQPQPPAPTKAKRPAKGDGRPRPEPPAAA